MESLVLVVPAINIVIETTMSWRVGCIGFYHHRDSGGGAVPILESRDSSAGLVPWWSRRKSSTIYRGYWTFGKVGVGERTGIVIEKN